MKKYFWSMLSFLMVAMLSTSFLSCGDDGGGDPTPPETLSVTPTEMSLLSSSGNSSSFSITSNGAWSVSCMADWLHLSARSGNGNSTITVTTITANSSSEVREAQILVQSGSLMQTITVSQLAGLATIKVTPTNLVALYNQLAWELKPTGEVNKYQMLCVIESVYNRKTEKELLEDLKTDEATKLSDEYIYFYSEDSYGNDIKPNTTYYICTVAYDNNDNIGEIVKTKVKTPAYSNGDNDAWVSFSNINVYSDAFQFTVNKQGRCNKYHVIYGNLPSDFRNYNSVLYAFQINYYLENGTKHWFSKNWGLEIVKNYPNDHSFTYYTNTLSTRPLVTMYGWGIFEDGTLSSDLMGGSLDINDSDSKRRMAPRKFDTGRNMIITRSIEEERANKNL